MYEITAALSSIKTISDIATFILKAKVGTEVSQKAIELQTIIITLQGAITSTQIQNHELVAENERLKQQLANAEKWEEETMGYQLIEVDDGAFVYAQHPNWNHPHKPTHWFCTNCYQKKQKSILQKKGCASWITSGTDVERDALIWIYTCANCNAEIRTSSTPSQTFKN